MDGQRLLVVVAHPDDETFGCGSLLLHAAAAGAVTAVVCATRGEAGEVSDGSSPTPDELGVRRETELRAAATALGVSEVHLLDFRDSGMAGEAAADTLVGADVDAVSAAVRERIAAFRPTIVVTLDGADGHRDHARIGEATLAAVDVVPDATVYLFGVPRSLLTVWLRHMSEHKPGTEHLEIESAVGTPDEDITTVVDTTEHLAARAAAMALHASQSSPFDGLPDELRRRFLGADHLIRVRPAWTGGPRETALLPGH